MKAVILAGGLGTRLSEETAMRPKPMVEIGGRPILWHIMKIYSHHDINDFIICCGYKSYMIKEYFANYFMHMSDIRMHMRDNRMEVLNHRAEPWTVTMIDTGEMSMTGGRLKRIAPYVEDDEEFCVTYGDGVGDIDITDLVAFHRAHGKRATVTSVAPPGRFGALQMDGHRVLRFQEKPSGDGGRVNGGFFVLKPSALDYVVGDETVWELDPLHSLAADGELMAYEHEGFWQAMDTLRDKTYLEELLAKNAAPWKTWED
jgi:glucose-1-phosphate cytidylyltransferase